MNVTTGLERRRRHFDIIRILDVENVLRVELEPAFDVPFDSARAVRFTLRRGIHRFDGVCVQNAIVRCEIRGTSILGTAEAPVSSLRLFRCEVTLLAGVVDSDSTARVSSEATLEVFAGSDTLVKTLYWFDTGYSLEFIEYR